MAFAPPKVLQIRRQIKAPDPFVAGHGLARRGHHDAACQQYSKLIDTGRRQDAEIFACRGGSAQALGDHIRAVYDYSMAIRLQPNEPSHYTARAVSLAALRQIETLPGALRDHSTAVELVSRNPEASSQAVAGVYLARGLALEQAGKLSDAVHDLSRALDELAVGEPAAEVSGAQVRRGSCLRRLDRVDEALVDLRAAVAREPKVASYRRELALALLAASEPDPEGATAELAVATELRPEDAALRVERARALWALGMPEAAAAQLEEAQRLSPHDVRARDCSPRDSAAQLRSATPPRDSAALRLPLDRRGSCASSLPHPPLPTPRRPAGHARASSCSVRARCVPGACPVRARCVSDGALPSGVPLRQVGVSIARAEHLHRLAQASKGLARAAAFEVAVAADRTPMRPYLERSG